jgi:hypothetical protein
MSRAALSLAAMLASAATAAHANVLFSENFDARALGALDKNAPAGPNAAPNGSGNPWFGPLPPNLIVVNSESGVTPTSGAQMIRGRAPNDFDQVWYNLAYRLNAGEPLTGNIRLDFRLYDPLGAGGTDFRDFGALGFYNTAPADTDHPANGSLNTGVSLIQRLSLGASSVQDGGFDPNFYQARVVGASDGYGAAGWFNTSAPRTVGWHAMRIDIGPRLPDGTNDVSFFVDDMNAPALTHNSVLDYGGYNVIELNQNYGAVTGYMDDVAFSARTTGDVNLDGALNPDDYALLDKGFAEQLKGYANGDINASGAIDSADYLLLDTAYGQQNGLSPELLDKRLATFGPDYVATLTAAVPEPSSLAAVLLATFPLLRRRRP